MARSFSFNGGGKTITASATQTIVWTSSEIESTGVVNYKIALAAATGTVAYSDVTRMRVKANGAPIVDCTPAQMQALQQRMSPNNIPPLDASLTFGIPLNAFDQRDDRASDTLQFPRGALAQVELDYTAGAITVGRAFIGWNKADPGIQPVGFQKFLSYQTQVPAGINNLFRTPLAETGLIRAIVLPNSAYLSRARCVINNREIFNVTGIGYQATAGSMLMEMQQEENTVVRTDPVCLVLELGEPALAGQSWIEWTTIASYPASTEIAILSTEAL